MKFFAQTKSAHTYVYTYIHTYIHTYVHTYTHTYMQIICSYDLGNVEIANSFNKWHMCVCVLDASICVYCTCAHTSIRVHLYAMIACMHQRCNSAWRIRKVHGRSKRCESAIGRIWPLGQCKKVTYSYICLCAAEFDETANEGTAYVCTPVRAFIVCVYDIHTYVCIYIYICTYIHTS